MRSAKTLIRLRVAQADLNLRWSHKSYRRFCRALAHMIHDHCLRPRVTVTYLFTDCLQIMLSDICISQNHSRSVQFSPLTLKVVRVPLMRLQQVLHLSMFGCASNWRPGGHGFDPRRGRQHSSVEIDHEIFSTVIFSLPLIQEGSCQFLAKVCAQYWLTAYRTKPAQ